MAIFDIFKKKEEEKPGEESSKETSLEQGLAKTKAGFFSKLGKALVGRSTVDAAFLDDLEDALVSADVGVQTTVKIIERLEKRVARDKYLNTSELNRILRDEIISLLSEEGRNGKT